MTPHTLFDADPLTTSWLIAIATLLVVLVVIPLLRAAAAGLIYAFAAATGRQHLRATAARVMPRIAHLIGGLVIGTAAVAAPAMAAVDAKGAIAGIDLDRDAGASRIGADANSPRGHGPATPSTKQAETPATAQVQAAPQQHDSAPASRDAQQTPADAVYVVRTGDTLWDIAAAHMDEPTNQEITEAWKSIWRANRAVIGDEPGLIHPGQQLDLGALS